jgi:hypothetical protein
MLKDPSDISVVKAMVEDVAVVIEEANVDLLQTPAELISAPLLELLMHMSAYATKKRAFASSVKRRQIVFSSAQSCRVRNRSTRPPSTNDGGMAALRMGDGATGHIFLSLWINVNDSYMRMVQPRHLHRLQFRHMQAE